MSALRRRRWGRIVLFTASGLALGALLTLYVILWLPNTFSGDRFIDFPKGTGTMEMSRRLAEAGVIFCSISEALREHPELVKQYLGLSEAQTFRSWTVASTIAGSAIFVTAALLWSFV